MTPETFYVATDDGWQLAVHHCPARSGRRRHPVLMVHGIGANRLHFILDERHSMARAACNRGFDVYVLELRGAGLSRAPRGRNRLLYQWGFGDHADLDMPAALRAVVEHARVEQMHAVAHSMGGMLLYSLATQNQWPLRTVTTIGSPLVQSLNLNLGGRERRLLQFGTKLAPSARQTRVPLRRLVGAAGLFIPLTARMKDGILLNLTNVEQGVAERMAREAIHDIPVQLVSEITGAMTSTNGKRGPYSYEAGLGRVRVPVLAVSGCMDRVSPSAAVLAAAEQLGSSDVRYRKMGTANGDRADYGHADLLVGRRAPEEVYPLVLDFLDELD